MAKLRTIAAATLTWLGSMASVYAQMGYAPMSPPPGAMAPPPPPPGVMPAGMMSSPYQPVNFPPGMMPPPLPPVAPPGPPGSVTNSPPGNAFVHGSSSDSTYIPPVGGWQFTIEPFLMYYSGARFPALLTTGDVVNDAIPGALDQPGTRTLFGGQDLVGKSVLGLRLTIGRTFGDDDRGSIDVSGWGTNRRTRTFTAISDDTGNPLITRPFFNPVAGQEDADIRAFPGAFSGSTHDVFSTQMYGLEANIRWDFFKATPEHMLGLTLLVGPRYFQLNEYYRNFDTAVELPAGVGNSFEFTDYFGTRNHFYGGQVGAVFKIRWDNLSVDFTTKAIGGNNSQSINIAGFTRLTDSLGNSAIDGTQALYAMQSNGGQWNRDRITYGGEAGVNFGFRLAQHFRFNFGYTYFAINNMVRPGDQIDRSVNIQPLFSGGGLGVARPLPTLRETMFNTHSINFGFEFLF
jgi:hypothetical protein